MRTLISDFLVGNQMVRANESTLFVDGTRADAAQGVKLKTEGSLEDGVLFDEIEFWEPNQAKIKENVADAVVSISGVRFQDTSMVATQKTTPETSEISRRRDSTPPGQTICY